MQDDLKKQTISSIIWKFFEKCGTQIMQFVVSLVLARLIMPEDFGLISITTIFITIANVFAESGFSAALIRKQNADDLDYSSVFYCNVAISVVLYLLIFFVFAPLISNFYEMPLLKNVIRCMGLTILLGGYNSIQKVILAKKLLFRRLFISSFIGIIISSGVGIGMAYAGFGVWALVAQNLTSLIVITIIMLFTVKWHPRLMFSFKRLKMMFGFGWKLLITNLINSVYDNLYSLAIGKKYSEADLAYWARGRQFPGLLIDNINGAIGGVMYPVMVRQQDDVAALKATVRRSVKTLAFIIFPMMVGMMVCAEPMVLLLLGENWLPVVPFLQAACVYFMFVPFTTTCQQLYQAMGKGGILLTVEIIKRVLGTAILFSTLFFGLQWLAIGFMLDGIASCILSIIPCKRLVGYGIFDLIKDVLPIGIITAVMGASVWMIHFIPVHYAAILLMQIIAGILVYIVLSYLFKLEAYIYSRNIVKKFFEKIFRKHKKTTSISDTLSGDEIKDAQNSSLASDAEVNDREETDTGNDACENEAINEDGEEPSG